MEAKRKMEELERKRQEDEDLRAAVALQVRWLCNYFVKLCKSVVKNRFFNINPFFNNNNNQMNFHATNGFYLQAQLEKEAEEDNQYRQQLEQERRDHELAMRLAQESNSQVDDSPLLMRKYEMILSSFSL